MLILFGFKGVGKTYFGKRVAAELGIPFVDTDDLFPIECRKMGQNYFREVEKKAIASLHGTQQIVAVGGGAVLEEQNLLHLQKIGRLVYLVATKETLRGRGYPVFESDFDSYYAKRLPLYERIPAVKIDVEKENVLERLKELYGQ